MISLSSLKQQVTPRIFEVLAVTMLIILFLFAVYGRSVEQLFGQHAKLAIRAGAGGTGLVVAGLLLSKHRYLSIVTLGGLAMVFNYLVVAYIEWAHLVLFGGFAFLTWHCDRSLRRLERGLTTALYGLLAASLDETVQSLCPSRVGELRDVAVSFLGVVAGIVVADGMSGGPSAPNAFD